MTRHTEHGLVSSQEVSDRVGEYLKPYQAQWDEQASEYERGPTTSVPRPLGLHTGETETPETDVEVRPRPITGDD